MGRMARLKRQLPSFARLNVPLSSEEFASLREVGNRSISDEHRDRLITAGYIREVVGYRGGVRLVLTGQGLRRIERGK